MDASKLFGGIRARTIVAAAACVFAVLAPMTAEAKVKCRDLGTEAKPVAAEAVSEIRTPNGPFRFRNAERSRKCSEGKRSWDTEPKYGLMGEKGGKVLVPAKYDRVAPISDTTALVRVGDGSQPYRFYQFGVGETGTSPYYHAEQYTDGTLTTVTAWSDWSSQGPRTLYVFEGGAQPVVVPGAIEFAMMGNISKNYILNFVSETGEPLSRIVDPAVRPLTPAIGRTEIWQTFPVDFSFNAPSLHFPRDLVSRSMKFEHPMLPYDTLYLPVSPDGKPLPLPEGAVGVFPLKRSPNVEYSVLSRETFGWAVVFPTRDGFEIAPILAPLTQALEQAPAAKKYTGMRRNVNASAHGEMMLRDADGWRAVGPEMQPLHFMPPDAVFSDPDEGFIAVTQTWKGNAQREYRAREEAAAVFAEARRIEGDAMWANVQSGLTDLCSVNPGFLPPDGLERFFAECEMDRNTQKVFGSKVSAGAFAAATKRREAAEQAMAEARERETQERFFGGPEVSADPWAAGLAAAQAAADTSFNTFMQRQSDVYQSNLEAWNSGAHNWRPAQ